ncbi:MAG: hypothetical protein M1431_03660 [Candidatus Thermoplasmatota archaeon]|nr:hypothetical protein [Candidatus Thermoplasmatota archaeon]
MERLLSYSSAYEHLQKALVSEPNPSSTFIIQGRRGYGKSVILSQIAEILKNNGDNLYWSEANVVSDVFRLNPFNEILNQATGDTKERTLNEIVEGFNTIFKSSKKRNVIFVEGIDRMETQARDFFYYLSKISKESNFVLLGGLSDTQGESLISSIPPYTNFSISIEIIRLKRPELSDFRFYLDLAGYRIPDNFLAELNRLVDGSFEMLFYSLKYYKEQGIINSQNELQEASFRYFPIPPGVEILYRRTLEMLDELERRIIQILSILNEDLNVDYLAQITGQERSKVLEILDNLIAKNLVSVKNMSFRIGSQRLSEIVLESMSSSSGQMVLQSFVDSSAYEDLPFVTKLKILLKVKDQKMLETTVLSQWNKIYQSGLFYSVNSDFFISLEKQVKDPAAKNALKIMAADTLFNENRLNTAYDLYSSQELSETFPGITLIGKAKILWRNNQFDQAIEVSKEILDSNEYSDRIRGEACVNLSNCHYSKGEEKTALEYSKLAEKIALENKLEDVLADSYNSMGTLSIKNFDLESAQAFYNKSLELNRKLRRYDKILQCLNNIAILQSYRGKFGESIEILQDLIEESYINGDIISRGYAMYNLSEILYFSGRFQESLNLSGPTERLVEYLNDSNLSYPFYRFRTVFEFLTFRAGKSAKYAEKMEADAKILGNESYIRIADSLKKVINIFAGDTAPEELDSVFARDISDSDDFAPMWYFMGTMHFVSRNRLNDALKMSKHCTAVSSKLGDFFGLQVAKNSRIIVRLAKLDLKGIGDELHAKDRELLSSTRYGRIEEDFMIPIVNSESDEPNFPEPMALLDLFLATYYKWRKEKRNMDGFYVELINKYRKRIV